MTGQPPAALQPEDFDAQDAVLDRLREADETVPDWEFCEGFLTALACTRRRIEPDAWWPALLGAGFRPMAEMEFVWRALARLREIEAALDAPVDDLNDPRALQPATLDARGAWMALPEHERPPEVNLSQLPAYAQAWALGFLEAVDVWAEEWAPPRDAEAAQIRADALADIERLAGPDTAAPAFSMHEEHGPPSVSEQRFDQFGAAIWGAYALRALGKSLGPRTEPLRKPAAPGRNDACPCGSGKKFKRCCGA